MRLHWLTRVRIDSALRAGERPTAVARSLGVSLETVSSRRRLVLRLPRLVAEVVPTARLRALFADCATAPTLREVADRYFRGSVQLAHKRCKDAGLAFRRIYAVRADYDAILAFLVDNPAATTMDASRALGVTRFVVHNAVTLRGASALIGLRARHCLRMRSASWRETCLACGVVRSTRRGNSAPDLCPTCSRRAIRNGRCSCGMPFVRVGTDGRCRVAPRCPRCLPIVVTGR